ncbi:hypothetical protein MPTK1_1g29530 [Marchantia polymorpha subsp. ruderalis]|nr:hypothetical protein MARPO_0139s0021 [Marchantia polymorpha]BBN00481.1 hypothetical protein Mp_1g29530 [Marchantia polymorpha subsp. ruderalis]|eukprot:PTQ29550.1 hypothetical protein MARPO_0139s0021 [Marchantia polymorpha]
MTWSSESFTTARIWESHTWITSPCTSSPASTKEDYGQLAGVQTRSTGLQPFIASYKDLDVDSCAIHSEGNDKDDSHRCYNKLYCSWYGGADAGKLTNEQIDDLKRIQSNYVIHDYCTDAHRFHETPKECARNSPQSYPAIGEIGVSEEVLTPLDDFSIFKRWLRKKLSNRSYAVVHPMQF